MDIESELELVNKVYDVIILGAGPAGLAAGIHSALFGLKTLVLDANEKAGGLAVRARGVENYPGFIGKVSGLKLMEKMARQAAKAGVELRTSEEATGLSLKGKEKVVKTRKNTFCSKILILATGDAMKGLGMKWETWIGGGVTYCAQCAEPFLEDKDIVVVGNVKDAVEEALRLTKVASSVRLVNHENSIVFDKQMRKQLDNEGVRLIEDFGGVEIKGKPPLKRLLLRCLNNTSTKTLKTNIIFVVAGVKPFVSVLRKAGVATHRQGCVIVDEFGRTSIKEVFATGGCASTVKDIIPTCVGDGAKVATYVYLYLKYGGYLS